jgi:uncharacterized protein with PIN domain
MSIGHNFDAQAFDSHSGELVANGPLCPRCSSELVRRSRRRNLRDRVMSLFSRLPYRCDECDLRFYSELDSLSVAYSSK